MLSEIEAQEVIIMNYVLTINNKDTNKEIESLIQEYVDMQEEAVEKLKTL